MRAPKRVVAGEGQEELDQYYENADRFISMAMDAKRAIGEGERRLREAIEVGVQALQYADAGDGFRAVVRAADEIDSSLDTILRRLNDDVINYG